SWRRLTSNTSWAPANAATVRCATSFWPIASRWRRWSSRGRAATRPISKSRRWLSATGDQEASRADTWSASTPKRPSVTRPSVPPSSTACAPPSSRATSSWSRTPVIAASLLPHARDIFEIDPERVAEDARFDGLYVLRTNSKLPPLSIALAYRQLWKVEAIFRTAKSILETRPIYHQSDATIAGHLFCSFLALVVRKELDERLVAAGVSAEWADIVR